MREFVRGVALLGRGFATWRRRPGLMMLGLLPAAIVGALFLTGLIVLSASLPGLTDAMTPFADGWPTLWATVFRIAVGTALLGAALVLVVVTFTAVTLLVGDPFYERIWRSVETDAGAAPPDARYGFWRSVADGLSLIGRGLVVALLAALIGLVPVVGGALSAVFGVTLTGWLVADELTSRAFTARGMARSARRHLMRRHRARVLGFGVATQLTFLVPLGAVVTMPAAVAGATLLARSMLDATPSQPEARGSAEDLGIRPA
jgi:CysZ protein